jgi:G3E family GTPase
LTGFLGSGKTTLLRHLVSEPGFRDTAVVINEFGEIGLDHLLVREVTEDVVLLPSGCLCCILRDDLISSLVDLHRSMEIGRIPRFSRIAIETTGLADPMPILQVILSDKQLSQICRLGQVVTTIDGVNGLATIERHNEAARQIAAANCLVLTKADVIDHSQSNALVTTLSRMNRTARLCQSRPDAFPAATELFDDAPSQPASIVLKDSSSEAPDFRSHAHDRISTFVIRLDKPVDLAPFIEWLDLLLTSRGESVLRVKGYLAPKDHARPLVIQGVQRVVYRPEPLHKWPSDPGISELVFITEDLTPSAVERSLKSFLGF